MCHVSLNRRSYHPTLATGLLGLEVLCTWMLCGTEQLGKNHSTSCMLITSLNIWTLQAAMESFLLERAFPSAAK